MYCEQGIKFQKEKPFTNAKIKRHAKINYPYVFDLNTIPYSAPLQADLRKSASMSPREALLSPWQHRPPHAVAMVPQQRVLSPEKQRRLGLPEGVDLRNSDVQSGGVSLLLLFHNQPPVDWCLPGSYHQTYLPLQAAVFSC